MYTIVELTRLSDIDSFYVPTDWPFVVSYKFYYGAANEDIASFWSTTFGVTEELTTKTYITGVVLNNNINYTKKNSIAELYLDEQSYFWDNDDQTLYIHLNHSHSIDYVESNFSYGLAVGLSTDKVRYLDHRVYKPFLLSNPEIERSVDKFIYDTLTFIVADLKFSNKTKELDIFKTVPLYGNKLAIKTGEENDSYDELVERVTLYIEDYNFSALEFNVKAQDIRKTLTAQVPNTYINATDYPYAGDSTIGTVIPFGYSPTNGFIRDVEGLCVNEVAVKSSGSYPQFVFLEVLRGSSLSDIEVFVKDSDDVWQEQSSGVSVNWTTGVVTINGARTGTSPNYDVLPVRANVKGVANTYASDIIKDFNERFLGLAYDTSNYDITEWEAEEIYLAPVSFFMDSTKDIYEWIKDIQGCSSVGFRYTNTAANKRTIRVDNPNRDSVFTVPSVNVKNPARIDVASQRDEVYNIIKVGYNKSISQGTAERVENRDYYDESFAKYRIETVYDSEQYGFGSGLTTYAEAVDSAALKAEDYWEIHNVFSLELIGEKYLDLQLYDVLEVYITLYKKEFILNDVWQATNSSVLVKQKTLDTGSTVQLVARHIAVEDIGDDYYGLVRGQVISVKPNYKLQTNTIKLRQRDYSEIWENIYG